MSGLVQTGGTTYITPPKSQIRLGTTCSQPTRVTPGSSHTSNHRSYPAQGHTTSCNRSVCYDQVKACNHDGESVAKAVGVTAKQCVSCKDADLRFAYVSPLIKLFVTWIDGLSSLAYSEDGGRSIWETLTSIYQTMRHRIATDSNFQK